MKRVVHETSEELSAVGDWGMLRRMNNQCRLILTLGLFSGTLAGWGMVKPGPAFGDHMVLQRDKPVVIWGTADPGEKVVVKFRGQEKTITAGPDTHWKLELDPLGASSEGQVLQIGAVMIQDVLVGEIWFGAGQSNMNVGTGGAMKTDPEMEVIASKDYPRIRVARGPGMGWRVATAQANPGISALALSFAVRLQEQLKVPVGMAIGAVGGTSTEFWLTGGHLQADPACAAAIARYGSEVYPGLVKKYEAEKQKWEETPAEKRGKNAPRPPAKPGGTSLENHIVGKLYEQHVRPWIPMTIRGVLWDQGENISAAAGPDQVMVMSALIRGWRKDWGQGEFPWVYLQKPSGGGCAWDPADPLSRLALAWTPLPDKPPGAGEGRYREWFLRILETPQTAMAITSDLAPGVHPPTKSAYGTRAARAALALAYGGKGEIYGPLYASHAVEGSTVRIRFHHTGKGLAFRGGDQLQGFMVAGEDRKFQWGHAVIDGETVVVSAPGLAKPASVRYEWSDKCPWANLFNQNGLPAQAFRTDSW